MAHITSDTLRDIAILCTEKFLNDRIPLSQGLAKEASVHGLNPDQIQRCVEATNTVAFLKVRALSDDKTCEFPLAKYAEVMASIALPETSAEAAPSTEGVFTKAASDMAPTPTEMDAATSAIYLEKRAGYEKSRLADLEMESYRLVREMEKTAAALRQDPQGLDKMAQVMGDEYTPLSSYVSGSVQNKLNLGGAKLFTEFQTKQARDLSALYKEAQLVCEQMAGAKESLQSFEEHRALTKAAAFPGATGATSASAKAGPSAPKASIPKPPIGGQKGVAERMVTGVKRAATPTGAFEKGVAKATSVASAIPAKALGVPVQIAADAGRAAGKAAAGLVGLTPNIKAPAMVSRVAGGSVMKALSVGTDAAMYSPGIDKTTGVSRDIWDALQ
jgi:hypothetical protein